MQAGISWPVFKPWTKFLGPALFYPLKRLKLGSSTGEPGGLPSMGSHRVRHDWSDLAAAACFTLGFPGGASGKEHACQCWRHKRCGFYPWVRKILWRRAHNPLQYSCLENPRDREEPGRLQSIGPYRGRHDLACMHMFYFLRWHFKSRFLYL